MFFKKTRAALREAKAQEHPGPYTITVVENIGTTGAGLFDSCRYRWTVTDGNGRPAKVGYGMTHKTSHLDAEHYVSKLEGAAS